MHLLVEFSPVTHGDATSCTFRFLVNQALVKRYVAWGSGPQQRHEALLRDTSPSSPDNADLSRRIIGTTTFLSSGLGGVAEQCIVIY
jgi:hypothetical protein